jgi:hypothetical protein
MHQRVSSLWRLVAASCSCTGKINISYITRFSCVLRYVRKHLQENLVWDQCNSFFLCKINQQNHVLQNRTVFPLERTKCAIILILKPIIYICL